MRLVYVFDWRETDGYACRVPAFLAYVICKAFPRFDYAETVKGY